MHQKRSFALHQELWAEIGTDDYFAALLPRLFLAVDDRQLEPLRLAAEHYQGRPGFSARMLGPEEARSLEPRLTTEVRGALYTEGNGAVDARAYTCAIATACLQRGATWRVGRVTGLNASPGLARGVLLEDGELSCDQVVIATGAWANQAGTWLGFNIPVEPLQGEMVLVEFDGPPIGFGSAPRRLGGLDVTLGEVSLYFRGSTSPARTWVGATESRSGFANELTPEARRAMLDGAVAIMPELARARVLYQSSGLRPVTPDALPIVGRAPGWENVFLCTGAGRKGTLLSAGMARAVADLIGSGRSSVPIDNLAVDRFHP